MGFKESEKIIKPKKEAPPPIVSKYVYHIGQVQGLREPGNPSLTKLMVQEIAKAGVQGFDIHVFYHTETPVMRALAKSVQGGGGMLETWLLIFRRPNPAWIGEPEGWCEREFTAEDMRKSMEAFEAREKEKQNDDSMGSKSTSEG